MNFIKSLLRRGDDGASTDSAASLPESHVTVAVRIKPTDSSKTLMRFGTRAELCATSAEEAATMVEVER